MKMLGARAAKMGRLHVHYIVQEETCWGGKNQQYSALYS